MLPTSSLSWVLRLAAPVVVCVAPLEARQDWQQQLPAPGSTWRDLHVQSALSSWAVGGDGVARRTQDGGLTWVEHDLPTDGVEAVRFANSSTGLVVGSGIARTDTAGTTWSLVAGQSGLRDVVFPTPSLALACGENGRVLRSSDAGQTWSSMTLGGEDLLGLSFFGPSTGLVVGTGGSAFRTVDGGLTWQAIATGIGQVLSAVDLVSSQEAYVTAGDLVLHTEDLGQSWTPLALPAGRFARTLDFVTGSQGWVAGNGGWVAFTTDGGQSWSTGLSEGIGALLAIGFADFSNGLVVGENGRIFRSTNGGLNWDQVSMGIQPPDLRGFHAVNPSRAWATGGLGEIFRTQDAGATWQAGVIDGQAVYRDVSFADADFGVVTGNRQGVFPAWGWTLDGGDTWNTGSMTAQFDLHTAEAFGDGKAMVAGETWVLVTNNAWQNFSFQSLSPFGTYYGSAAVGDRLWLVGSKFFRSLDGGASWEFLLDPTTTFRDVSFSDADHGWAVGDFGQVLKSNDGGSGWQAVISPPGAPDLLAVKAVSPSEVWIAGENEYAVQTQDGGASWTVLDPPGDGSNDVAAIEVFSTGALWAAGGSSANGGRVWRGEANADGCEVEGYCSAKLNSLGGICSLSASGSPDVSVDDFEVVAQGAIPNQPLVLFFSDTGSASTPLLGGTLCMQPPVVRLTPQFADGTGSAAYPVVESGALVGLTRYFQVWYRDPAQLDGTGVGLSDGLRVTFCD